MGFPHASFTQYLLIITVEFFILLGLIFVIKFFKVLFSVNSPSTFFMIYRSVFILLVTVISACQSQSPGDRSVAESAALVKSDRDQEDGVVLNIFVLPDGSAGVVNVEKSSGSAGFDQYAVDFYRKARFIPASRDGKPVAAWKLIMVTPSPDLVKRFKFKR
ncbi:MAG TPA: TonB family protein [Spongiibacteraceae bacterium]|nr:TonB family protein [Spongiibacteraceae bacterium]